jgi:glutamyl-tRNA synthetase
MLEDLRWFGFQWQEGPDCGGLHAPYSQSERRELYRAAFEKLRAAGLVYLCVCSRQDVLRALQAPHAGEDEPIYPGTCRPGGTTSHSSLGLVGRASGARPVSEIRRLAGTLAPPQTDPLLAPRNEQLCADSTARANWRFRIPDGDTITFDDGYYGRQRFVAGCEFGDFVVWRHDDLPSYQLAVVVDDAEMAITEVVRGDDLLKSTARQLLLYHALGLTPPKFYHCPLMTDEAGVRLAKRHDALSLRSLRSEGVSPEELRRKCSI